jgi:diphthamide synthase subunit DPH2
LRQQKKKILINLLLKEIGEEDIFIEEVITKRMNDMYSTRKEEGFCSVLIEKHLFRDKNKFRQFFRLS